MIDEHQKPHSQRPLSQDLDQGKKDQKPKLFACRPQLPTKAVEQTVKSCLKRAYPTSPLDYQCIPKLHHPKESLSETGRHSA